MPIFVYRRMLSVAAVCYLQKKKTAYGALSWRMYTLIPLILPMATQNHLIKISQP